MIGTVTDAWLRLASMGAVGFVIALVLAAFAVLIVANAVIWPIAGVKRLVGKKNTSR